MIFHISLTAITFIVVTVALDWFFPPKMASQGLSPGDPSSFSRPDLVIVTNIFLTLDVHFERKTFGGIAELSVKKIDENVNELILDVKDLDIDTIFDKKSGNKLLFTISATTAGYGAKLTVELPPQASNDYVLSIVYDTTPAASGLQWLTPEQTAGKKHPYVFSQFQSIAARSFLPCQDTPIVKTKYQAQITVPLGLTAIMSAICDSSKTSGDKTIFHFVQDIPIQSYLIAIAIGALESRDIGPRSKVWSEKEVVDDAAYEFADTEHQLRTAEEICGPYVWGRYDLLILPPSFPFGGMENPCLTFVTPTTLAGDRSLANVVAHEVAHSWSGNLVTNANFEHFWLNEGFTVLIERKILGRLTNKKLQDFDAYSGLQNLKETINHLGKDNPLTRLVVDLKGVHPDDAFSLIPYEKGSLFLRYLENVVGGPEQFEPFLLKYFDTYKYKSITSDDFRSLYQSYFSNVSAIKDIDWNTWFYSPGLPPVIPEYDMTYADVCTEFTKRFIDWCLTKPFPFTDEEIASLRAEQLIQLLDNIMAEKPQVIGKLQQFEEKFHVKGTKNAEVKFRWLIIGLRSKRLEAIDQALEWVVQVGRMKFLRPLYRELYKWEASRARAIKVYEGHKKNMMHLSAYTAGKELQLIKE